MHLKHSKNIILTFLLNNNTFIDDEDNLDDEEVDDEELGLDAVYKDNLDVSNFKFFIKIKFQLRLKNSSMFYFIDFTQDISPTVILRLYFTYKIVYKIRLLLLLF